jgi:hypothetical protein
VATITRRLQRRAKWWASAAALAGFVLPVAAQSTDSAAPSSLPPRPLPTLQSGGWPQFPEPSAIPSTPAPATQSSADSSPRIEPLKPTAPSAAPAVWMVSPANRGAVSPSPSFAGLGAAGMESNAAPASFERSPRDFGSGWRNFVNQQNTRAQGLPSLGGPVASLAAPRQALAIPRPEWSWHGYDSYNRGRPASATPLVAGATANEMAPFMKYSHLWRPAGATATAALAQANSPAGTSVATGGSPAADDDNARWTGYGSITPAGATRPSPVQFHSASQGMDSRQPTPESRPNVGAATTAAFYPLPAETGNRLPMSVREKVSQICAGRCRNLVVEPLSPIRLRIAFLVKDQTEADMLTNLLGSAQELAPYKVDFEVQIGQ